MVSKIITRKGSSPQLGIKAPVVTVAVENVALSALQTIDGYELQENDRVLLINQAIPTENGIYNASTVSWVRSPDWDNDGDVTSGVMILNNNRSAMYIAKFTGYFIPGTTVVTFPIVYGTVGIAQADGQTYNPGYTLTYINATSFTVEEVNAVGLYHVNRRVRLVGSNGLFYFGVVLTVSYSSPDTTVTMTMDGSDVVPVDLISAVLVTDGTQWASVAVNNHLWRTSTRGKIISGRIGAEIWWVIVGDNRQIHVSRDAGATWDKANITGPMPETINLNGVAYDNNDQGFWAGGSDNWILTTSDAINWVSSQPSDLVAATTLGDGNLQFINYGATRSSGSARGFVIRGKFSSATQSEVMTSTDKGVTWISRASLFTAVSVNFYKQSGRYWFSWGGTMYQSAAVDGNWGATNEGSSVGPMYDLASSALANAKYACGNFGEVWKGSGGGLTSWFELTAARTAFGSGHNLLGIAISESLDIRVAVSAGSKIGYAYRTTEGTWTLVSHGFNPGAKILAIHRDEDDAMFIAISDDGNICRSTNGIN